MDYRVIWTTPAYNDLEQIAEFIAIDSKFYSSAVVKKIKESSLNLSTFPFRGRIVPELNEETIREIFVYNYRLIYKVNQDTVFILAVVHSARDLDNVFI